MYEMYFYIEMSCNTSPSICILFCNVCDDNLRRMSTNNLSYMSYYRRMTFVIVLVEKEIILFYSVFSRIKFFMDDS